MNNCYRILITTTLLMLAGPALAHDPGEKDTVWLETGPIGIGMSSPVTLSIFNDSVIYSWAAKLRLTSDDASRVTYDSVRYLGRLADPSVEPVRIVTPHFSSDYTFIYYWCFLGLLLCSFFFVAT